MDRWKSDEPVAGNQRSPSSLDKADIISTIVDEVEVPLVVEEVENVAVTTAPHNDRSITSVRNLFCAWAITLLTAVDGTVAVPSLWRYVESLGGNEFYYGLCISSFALMRLITMGLFGRWVDRRPYKEVFLVSLSMSMLAGLIYAMAPTVGIWAILVGRGVLGAMSAVSVATQAFVSNHTRASDRTKYMAINTAINNGVNVCGPAFNLFIIYLPTFNVMSVEFTSYTWVGYFLFTAQVLVFVFVLLTFEEPEMRPKLHKAAKPLSRFGRIVTLGGLFPWPRVFLDPWLRITGCWSMYCMNFRNNFIGFSMIYVLPLITARDYGYGQLENSYCFTVIAVTRMSAGALIATHLAKRYQDRTLIVLLTTIGALSILVYMSVSSCSQGALPVVVFVALFSAIQASDPAAPTQGLYSKLIGRGNAGLYFAVLQGNGAIARTLSGQLVGFAYGTLGPCALWAWCLSCCVLLVPVLCVIWPRLSPDYIADMHSRLETQDEDDAQVERKAPQTLLPDQSPLLQQLLVKESDLC